MSTVTATTPCSSPSGRAGASRTTQGPRRPRHLRAHEAAHPPRLALVAAARAEHIDALSPDLRTTPTRRSTRSSARSASCRARRQDETSIRRALASPRGRPARDRRGGLPRPAHGRARLYHGRIIEMVQGEGKTLTGSLVAPLLAWQHRYLHIYTVNDYLAQRDATAAPQSTTAWGAPSAPSSLHGGAAALRGLLAPHHLRTPSRSPPTGSATRSGSASSPPPGRAVA